MTATSSMRRRAVVGATAFVFESVGVLDLGFEDVARSA